MVKTCITCKHHKHTLVSFLFHSELSRCDKARSPVTGKPKAFCIARRELHTSRCGPDGKEWEPKDE